MKYIIFLILMLFGILLFWLVEPFSNNPFYRPEMPVVDLYSDCTGTTPSEPITAKVNSTLKKYISSGNFLGVSTGFYKADCGLLTASAGYSDKRNLDEFKTHTISRIASVTKPMTAVAIMQLYERGVIDLDLPIQTYLPRFPKSSKPVTIRHLLSHTSGIPHYTSKIDAMSFSRYPTLSLATEEIYKRGFKNPPGDKFIYSSFGYTVLGNVIENVTSDKLEDYFRKNIWEISGMANTSLEKSFSKEKKSKLYLKIGNIFVRSPHTDLSIIYPAGGVQSTAEDLLKFGQAIIENKLISRETLEMMIDVSHSLAPEAGDDPYGLGWTVNESPGHGRIISHGGSQPGASAQLLIYVDTNVVSVALSNAFGTKNSARHLAIDMGEIAFDIDLKYKNNSTKTNALAD